MSGQFWRWPQRVWRDESLDPQKASLITAGVDVGSVSSKAVVLVDRRIFAYSILRTGSSSPDSALRALQAALKGTGIETEDIDCIVGTGYGRVNVPFAARTISEITCHARGAHQIFGSCLRTVLDVGGQDLKAIRCDERGRVVDFLMNDKCAAGTGRGLEVFAELLGVPIEEMGEISLQVEEEPRPVSATCVVFARSEALGLLKQGWSKAEVAAAYCAAMAQRIHSLLTRLGVQRELAITGGIAKNRGVVRRLEARLGFKAMNPPESIPYDPQIVGALGASLLAADIRQKRV